MFWHLEVVNIAFLQLKILQLARIFVKITGIIEL